MGYQFRLRQLANRLNIRFEERLAERTRIAQGITRHVAARLYERIHAAARCG